MTVIVIVERGPDLATHFINLYQVARLRYSKAVIGKEMIKKTKQRERRGGGGRGRASRQTDRLTDREVWGGGVRSIQFRQSSVHSISSRLQPPG